MVLSRLRMAPGALCLVIKDLDASETLNVVLGKSDVISSCADIDRQLILS